EDPPLPVTVGDASRHLPAAGRQNVERKVRTERLPDQLTWLNFAELFAVVKHQHPAAIAVRCQEAAKVGLFDVELLYAFSEDGICFRASEQDAAQSTQVTYATPLDTERFTDRAVRAVRRDHVVGRDAVHLLGVALPKFDADAVCVLFE